MKALSIWQPWASLIIVGAKKFETRSWATRYRGPLLICAGKKSAVEHKFMLPGDVRALLIRQGLWEESQIPYGRALTVVDLIQCHKTECLAPEKYEKERHCGDFSPGRFAWELANIHPFKKPFPVRGQPGLFEVPDSLLESSMLIDSNLDLDAIRRGQLDMAIPGKELIPLKALRLMCRRCTRGNTKQVRECPQEDCPSW